MNYFDYYDKLQALKYMIEHHSTGSVKRLAAKLDVSERTVQRMVEYLKKNGEEIKFSRVKNSYVKPSE